MAIRDELNSAVDLDLGAYTITGVPLYVSGWTRQTIADGQWLLANTIEPLSARDIYLANNIDSANSSIATIQAALLDNGIYAGGSGTSGASTNGYNIKSVNKLIAANSTQEEENTDDWPNAWPGSAAIVSTGAEDIYAPLNRLTCITVGPNGGCADFSSDGIIVQGSLSGSSVQLLIDANGIQHRAFNNNSTGTADLYGNYAYSNNIAKITKYSREYKESDTIAISDNYVISLKNSADYLKTSALDDYYTSDDMDKTFLTNDDAEKYATKTMLNNYYKKTDMDDKFLTTTDASTTYATKTMLDDYYTKSDMDDKFLTTADASTTYATNEALGDYYTKSDMDDKFLTKASTRTWTWGDETPSAEYIGNMWYYKITNLDDDLQIYAYSDSSTTCCLIFVSLTDNPFKVYASEMYYGTSGSYTATTNKTTSDKTSLNIQSYQNTFLIVNPDNNTFYELKLWIETAGNTITFHYGYTCTPLE